MRLSVGPNPQPADAREHPHNSFHRIDHNGAPLAIRARYEDSDFGSSGPYIADTFGRMPSYLCALQLHDFPALNGWCDGKHHAIDRLSAGSFLLLDLRHSLQTEVPAPFDNVHLNVTQDSIDEVAAEEDLGRVTIELSPFTRRDDETLRHLALSLLPALQRPAEVSALFAAHVASAAALHLIHTDGHRTKSPARPKGGLAPWQVRRATELVLDQLDNDLELAQLASACELSPGHFARAFKQTTGLPPHRWLLHQRVVRAREMLQNSDEPLSAIATSCGFSDQSHLSRVFSRAVGVSPGAWRRTRRT
jgi:AraC family transcriptional regulator